MKAFWMRIDPVCDAEYSATVLDWIFSGVRVADPVQGAYYRPILG